MYFWHEIRYISTRSCIYTLFFIRCRVRYLPNKLYLNFLPVTMIAQFVGKSCNNLYHFHVYTAVVCNVQLKLSSKPSSAQFAMLMFPKSSYLTLTSMLSFCILWLLTEILVTLMPLAFRNRYFNCFLVAVSCFFVVLPCIFLQNILYKLLFLEVID